MVLPEKVSVPSFTSCARPSRSAALLMVNSVAFPFAAIVSVYHAVLGWTVTGVVPSPSSVSISSDGSSVGCSSLLSSSFLSSAGFSSPLLSSAGLLASPSPSPGFLSSSPGLVGCSSLPSSVFLSTSSLPSVSPPGLVSAGFVSPSTMVVLLPSTTSVAKAAGVTSVSVSTMLISRLTMRRDRLLVRFFM